MRRTRYEIIVNMAVKTRLALSHMVCHGCDDTVWFELMYQVSDHADKTYNICKACAIDKQKAYELINPIHTTVQDILIRNAERRAELAVKKIEFAQEGLKRIIQVMHEPNSDWNPDRDKVIVGVTVEAENTLRELDRETKTAQPPIRKRTRKREVIPETNKEQTNVQ